MSDIVLSKARQLYKVGFAVIWLHPKSKRPLESGWTTGPRKPWAYMEKTYKPGYNLGVRTGEPSKIGEDDYLTCIDVDIKDEAYREEAEAHLKKLVGEPSKFPTVSSGSGGGSCHLYCRSKTHFKMITIVKVKDKYEICVYSDGRQMVLPPSIHPDTGNAYKWATSINELPLMSFEKLYTSVNKANGNGAHLADDDDFPVKIEAFSFKVEDVEFGWLPVSDEIKRGITHGTNITDRSGFLLPATRALHSAGLSRDGILSVLSDPRHFISACAFDHAQTKDRTKAAEWLWKYTVRKVISERSASAVFTKVDEDLRSERALTPEEAEKQTTELMAEIDHSIEIKGFYSRGKNGAPVPEYDALLAKFRQDHPYKTIADMKAVYVFNGTHYTDFTPIEIKSYAEQMFKPSPNEKTRVEFQSKILANEVTRRIFFTESIESKINFQNGVLDLSDWLNPSKLIPHSPRFGFRGVLPYDFDPNAECPVFTAWLDGIMLGDKELVSILQEFMGYVVRGGDYKYHKALWLDGLGRNGKSTFIDMLKSLIGPTNYSTISIKALVGDKFAGAEMDGKFANFSEETSAHELADSGPFKNLTGDGDILAQKKYGDPYFFRNRAKLIMSYNEVPDLADLSPGMMSRPIVIPFRKVIPDDAQDRSIKKKLFSELSGIFNFALRGWERLEAQNGFTKSDASQKALKKLKEESCSVYHWIENYVEFPTSGGAAYRPHQLYEAYCKKERFPYKAPKFYRRLNTHPLIQEHRSKERDGKKYLGLGVAD